MKRMLSLAIVFGLIGAQPVAALPSSELASWAIKELKKVEYKKGWNAAATDAAGIRKEIAKVYNALPPFQAIQNKIGRGMTSVYNALPTREAVSNVASISLNATGQFLSAGDQLVHSCPQLVFWTSLIAGGYLSRGAMQNQKNKKSNTVLNRIGSLGCALIGIYSAKVAFCSK